MLCAHTIVHSEIEIIYDLQSEFEIEGEKI